jgi:hypothetical protein
MNKDLNRFYVYAYLRSKDSSHGKKGSPYYIGKGSGNRIISNQGRATKLPKDKSMVVYVQESLTEQQAFDLERYCIALYGRIDLGTGCLRNRTDGGEGTSGVVVSIDTRRKLSEKRRKNKNPNFGKTTPENVKRKMSEAKQGKNHPNWGKTRSVETCRKISKTLTGRVHSRESNLKKTLARITYLYELTDQNGEVYITNNLSEFSEQYNLDRGTLAKVIAGTRKSHKNWTIRIVEKLR